MNIWKLFKRDFRHSPNMSRPNTNNNNNFPSQNTNLYDHSSSINSNSQMSVYNNQCYATPHQQHMQQHTNINHMLSPRAPASNALNHQYQYAKKHQQPGQFPPYQDSKLNRFMNMWQRNHRVDPNPPLSPVSNSNNFRLSMHTPQQQSKPFVFDRKAIESSSSVWRDPNIVPFVGQSQVSPNEQQPQPQPPPPPPQQQQQRTSVAMRTPVTVTEPPVMESPKLSSWLPGLFHFKQPKVCSLECEARDEREAIGKISQVLQEVRALDVNIDFRIPY